MNWASVQTWAMTPGGIAVWLTLLFGLFFGSLLINVDRKIRLGREAALIALLAAVASASRVLFAALPNVQPVTLFILMIGLHAIRIKYASKITYALYGGTIQILYIIGFNNIIFYVNPNSI